MRQQPRRAVIVVLCVLAYYQLQVRKCGGKIADFHRTNCPAIEGIGRVGTGGNRAIVILAGARKSLFLEIKVGEFFKVAGRRIVEDRGFQLMNSSPARKSFEGIAKQASIGECLYQQVNQGSDSTAKQNDEDPIGVRAATNKVEDRESLEDDAPGINAIERAHAVLRANYSMQPDRLSQCGTRR